MAFRPINSAQSPFVKFIAGADIAKGQVLVVTSSEAVPAAEGIETAVILGVAVEDCADAATAKIYPVDQVFEADIYQGGSVDVATDAMLGLVYDLYVNGAVGDGSGEGKMYIDLNDTTGASFMVTGYDNTRRVVIGKFIEAVRYA